VTYGLLFPGMGVISGSLVILLLLVLLIYANPLLALISFLIFSFSYAGIYIF